jgi:hypothetical protein
MPCIVLSISKFCLPIIVLLIIACEYGVNYSYNKMPLQDTIIPYDQFQPKPPTSQDRDAGLCTVSQFPTQAANTTSKIDCPESLSEFQVPRSSSKHSSGNCPLHNL